MSGMEHPWEESRGMGFSYGYNRAEHLEHYHTGRELVTMLVDLVSRGGNLLLDIGPAADGTIPVLMEQRLIEIGSWLKVNGDAIYGTKPYKTSRQWSTGEQPKVENNKEFETAYAVTKLTPNRPRERPASRHSSPPRAMMFTSFCRADRDAASRSKKRHHSRTRFRSCAP